MKSLCTVLVFAALAWAADDKELLANYDPTVREAAANRLAGAGAKDAVPELIECLVDEALQVRVAALRALGMAGSDAKLALSEIRRLFRDKAPEVRTEAYVAAARVGDIAGLGAAVRLDKDVLDALDKNHDDVLRALLGDTSWHVRLSVLELKRVWRKAGPEWTASLAKLASKDPAQAVRYLAAVALRGSSDPAAAQHLNVCLDDRDARVREIALRSVARHGPVDAVVAARVEALLGDPDARVRAVALRAVTRNGLRNAAVAARVEAILEDPEAWVRSQAIYALRDRRESSGKIDARLDDKSEEVRTAAAALFASRGDWPRRGGDLVARNAIGSDHIASYLVKNGWWPPRAGGGFSVPIGEWARAGVLRCPKDATPLLLAIAATAEKHTRAQIVDLLVIMKQPDAVAQMRDDKNLTVRRHVAAGLVFLGTNDAKDLAVLMGVVETESDYPTDEPVKWLASARKLLLSRKVQVIPVVEARIAEFEVEKSRFETRSEDGRVEMSTERIPEGLKPLEVFLAELQSR